MGPDPSDQPKALITLRSAQVRRSSGVRGVRPVRERCEWPPQEAAPDRPPYLGPGAIYTLLVLNTQEQLLRALPDGQGRTGTMRPRLFDLAFAKLDMLARDRVVF